MSFRTKLDYSDNRQIQQRPETLTILSGSTSFGVTFSALTTGPDLLTSGVTSFVNSVASTFSGNSATTVYNWYDPIMALGYPTLTALTPSTSANTQYVTAYSANTTTIIDGNTVALDYVGVSYDITCSDIHDLGGGNYSGTAISLELDFLSAEALEFTGRTIWVDVSGITRTENLIITNNPVIGNVWTCIDDEGRGYWSPVTGSSGTSVWELGAGVPSATLIGGFSVASGDFSVAEGLATTASGEGSHSEGKNTTASGVYSHAQGSNTTAIGNSSHAEGIDTSASGDGSHSEGQKTTASGLYSHAGGFNSTSSGRMSFVHGSDSIASGANTIVLGAGIDGVVDDTTYVDNLNIRRIGIGPGTNIGINDRGEVVYTTSDIRLKENISTLTNALDKIKNLRGVTFQLKDRESGGDEFRIGFIAQEVNQVVPELTFINKTIPEEYMGVHYDNITALLVEAIKEMASGSTINTRDVLQTQTVVAEDNNIDLNFGGTQRTAVDGGIRVLHAKGEDLSADFIIDKDGDWITNNDLKPNQLTIPLFTPRDSSDITGGLGNITRDDDYIYIKCSDGWKRSKLERF